MKKKLILSLFTCTVAASSTSAALAMPQAGIYVGGDVDKYYGAAAFMDNLGTAIDDVLENLSVAVFVDENGNAANLNAVLTATNVKKVLRPAVKSLFEQNDYVIVGGGGAWNPGDVEEWKETPAFAWANVSIQEKTIIGTSVAYVVKAPAGTVNPKEVSKVEYILGDETGEIDVEKDGSFGFVSEQLYDTGTFTSVTLIVTDKKGEEDERVLYF